MGRRFSVHEKFEKPPEKSGFSIENQNYKVYLFSNHSQRLVFTSPTPGRSNCVSGSPAPIWSTGSPSTSLESCNTYLSLRIPDFRSSPGSWIASRIMDLRIPDVRSSLMVFISWRSFNRSFAGSLNHALHVAEIVASRNYGRVVLPAECETAGDRVLFIS